MDSNTSDERFLVALLNFHNIEELTEWAEKRNLLDNDDVKRRLEDIAYFRSKQSTASDELWKTVIDNFTNEINLLEFAVNNNYLYDRQVQARLRSLREVRLFNI